MGHILLAQASANWDATNQWMDSIDGLYYTPGDGDECRLNGYTVAMNLATIPASGTLAALNALNASGTATAGHLTVSLALGSKTINATTIQAGTAALIQCTGIANQLTVQGGVGTCTVTGGAGSNAYGISMPANSTCYVNGDVYGSPTMQSGMGIYVATGGGTVTVSGNVTARAGYGVYNPGGTTIVGGNVTGGMESGVYATPATAITGTVHVSGNVTGGTASLAPGIAANSSSISVIVDGIVTGGTGYYGITGAGSLTVNNNAIASTYPAIASSGSLTVHNGNLISSVTGVFPISGAGTVTYTPGPSNYIQIGGVKYPAQLPANEILYGTVHGDCTGTVSLPNSGTPSATGDASLVKVGAYFGPDNATEGTLQGASPTAEEIATAAAAAILTTPSNKLATDATGGALLASSQPNAVADAVLARNVSNAEAAAPRASLATLVLAAVNKSNTEDNEGYMTVYRTDGTTEHVRIPISEDVNAVPIDGVG